jgi:hypothetical protein
MALRTVAGLIPASAITATMIASGAITEAKLDSGAVTADKLGANAVTEGKIASGAVTEGKLADDAVTAAKLADGAASANLATVQAAIGTNVANLASGAPDTVDGYSLQSGDLVLVYGQSTASQNGIYQVDTVGTGSNGAWSRPTTRDQQAELPPGLLVIVTGGSTNGGAVFMLESSGTVGTDPLSFNRFHEGAQFTGSGKAEAVGTGDGSTLNFDLDVANPVFVAVFVDGLQQDPSVYGIDGEGGSGGVAQIQFTSGNAPGNGAKVEAIVAYIA